MQQGNIAAKMKIMDEYNKLNVFATPRELWLACEYHGSFQSLKNALPYLRSALNDDSSISAAEKKSRDVTVIGKASKANTPDS